MNNKLIPLALLLSCTAFTGNIVHAQESIITENNDKVYSIVEGSATDYHFTTTESDGSTSYYKINFNTNNIILDETKVSASDVSLPEMSIKPYFQYGLGVQKTVQDRYTAFLQVMLRNGGRNGIAANVG